MPVGLTEWRVRIRRIIQNPPDINKQEMIQRFLERWKAKKETSKTATSQQQTTTETSKVFTVTSYFERGLNFCQQLTSCVGFFVLFLSLILLIRSGDVESNPGPESTVSEMEFLELAQTIRPLYYNAVGISLEISLAQREGILIQHGHNYTNAFHDIFMKWNIKQLPDTNKREVLAAKLQDIDLGGLSNKLRIGSLIPNRTGAPSRPQTQPLQAESETKHLSPELIERCAKEFKSKYRSTLCKIRCNPLDPASRVQFEDIYTNLVLQEEHGRRKYLLDYNEILGLRVNGKFPNRIMVQGEAGAGKTTLCAKIAWDWVQEKYFSQFTWVLIVPLRDSKKYSIGEIAKSYLAKNNPATVSQITEFMRTNQDRVFIAFDGLDEFSGKVTKQDRDGSQTECYQSQSTDQAQATDVQCPHPRSETTEACSSHSQKDGISLTDILSSDELADCPVIVTTRPWRAIEIRSDNKLSELYTFIHVEGFSKENLSVYIHKYFRDDADRANQLIQFTKENDVISENMAHYPIYVAMLCLMWKELSEQKLKEIKSLQTFSQIFQEMVVFLKEHYCQKMIKKVGNTEFIAKLKEINNLLEPVAKLAFNGLLKNTLVFSEGDFQVCPESLETACRVGILSQEDRITSVIDIHDKSDAVVHLPVFFPHKLFQEYMAGIYLASLYESDRLVFNRLIEQVVGPRKEEFRYLLYFTVSQSKPIANHVMTYLVRGQPGPSLDDDGDEDKEEDEESEERKRERDFIVDVAFESQDLEVHVAALVRDSVSVKQLTIEKWMKAHTVAGYAFTRPHVVTLYVWSDCGPTMSVDIAEMICSIPSLKDAYFQASLHSDFYTTLAEKGNQSKVQSFKLDLGTNLTSSSSRDVAVALCSMPHLTYLDLDGMDLNEEFYSSLRSNALTLQIKTLRLYRLTCSKRAFSLDLGVALCSMPHLTHLTLGGLNLNEEFCSILRSRASALQIKTLELNGLTCPKPAFSHDLGVALCSMPHLTDLALEYMNLNEEFCSSLRSNALTLQVQTLKLWYVSCPTPSSSHDLDVAICSMPHLTDLTVEGKGPTFYSSLRTNALSLQGCFPQISNGNFRYNGTPVKDLNSFLCLLPTQQSIVSNAPLANPQVLGYDQHTMPDLDQLAAQLAAQYDLSVHERASSSSVPWFSHTYSSLPNHSSMVQSPNPQSRVSSTSVSPYQSSMVPSPNPQSRVGSTSVSPFQSSMGPSPNPQSRVGSTSVSTNQPSMGPSPNPQSRVGSTSVSPFQSSMVPSLNPQSRVGSTSVSPFQSSMVPSLNPQRRVGSTSVSPFQSSVVPSLNPQSRIGSTSVSPFQSSMGPSPDPQSRVGSTGVSPFQSSMVPSLNPQSRVGSTIVSPFQSSMVPSPNPQSRVGPSMVPSSNPQSRVGSTSVSPYQPSMVPSPNPQSRVGSTSVHLSRQPHNTSPKPPFLNPHVSGYHRPTMFIGHHTPLLYQQVDQSGVGSAHVPSVNLSRSTSSMSGYNQSPNPHSAVVSTHVPRANLSWNAPSISNYTRSTNPQREIGSTTVPIGHLFQNTPMSDYAQSLNPHHGVVSTHVPSTYSSLDIPSISDYSQSPNSQVSGYDQPAMSPESNSTNPDQQCASQDDQEIPEKRPKYDF